MTLCDICKVNPASFFQRHTRKRLCRDCFELSILTRVKDQIERYSMLSLNDTVAIGISGGKDSYVLVYILAQILSPNKIIGITIDEGITGYSRSEIYRSVKALCSSLRIDCIYVSMKEALGYSVDDFMERYLDAIHNKNINLPISACTYCGIARRRILNIYARELGATKVATGHNLDDEVQTYVINILRGDIIRLIQLHPLSRTHSPKLIKRIKPMRSLYEYETSFYAYLLRYPFQEFECPYIETRPTLRVKVREMLNEVEKLNPGAQLNLLEFLDNLVEHIINIQKISLPLCKLCGEPTSPNREICKFCELIELVKHGQNFMIATNTDKKDGNA
ncbi:MAG: ATP-binding protein [Ignisphaera sp.]|uniref:Adenine nucleotide alpha hydrolase family protein n=1 Tax=Ignisphaera aggregans TaxID=334771 RepID=A0A7C4JJV8_9CREN